MYPKFHNRVTIICLKCLKLFIYSISTVSTSVLSFFKEHNIEHLLSMTKVPIINNVILYFIWNYKQNRDYWSTVYKFCNWKIFWLKKHEAYNISIINEICLVFTFNLHRGIVALKQNIWVLIFCLIWIIFI